MDQLSSDVDFVGYNVENQRPLKTIKGTHGTKYKKSYKGFLPIRVLPSLPGATGVQSPYKRGIYNVSLSITESF